MQAVKTERLLQTLILLSTAALGYLFWDATEVRIVNVGDNAPHFEVRTESGILLSPSNFGGKLLVVNFWATWCPPCVQEVPSLEALHKMFKDSGLVVLGISMDKNETKYRSFLKRFGVTYQTARDVDAKIPIGYGTFRYPETYVIDRSGKVVQKIISNANFTDEAMIRFIKSQL
ncbi:MAG: TlpA family protein disulfide reductase [Acidobacteriia bacterium]|nr:TlpA family protein disulfide reductase [Terriglobia bacterium]